jgi:hypothetical protein
MSSTSILPLNIQPTTTLTTTNQSVVAEYLWDFEKNDFVLKDGKFQIVTGLQALEIWTNKALITQANTYAAYDNLYGQSFNTVVGQNFSRGVVTAEIQRLTVNCLTQNPYIIGIDNFSVDFTGDTLTINFTLVTTIGTTQISYS